jgi:hypothetical protein
MGLPTPPKLDYWTPHHGFAFRIRLRNFVLLVGILSLAMVFWVLLAATEIKRLSPPPGVNTLIEFAAVMPPPRRLAMVNVAKEERIVWIGESGTWSLPSGPACYVFDRSGRLLEWSAETGDGQRTTRVVRLAWDADQLTVKEAIDLTDDD